MPLLRSVRSSVATLAVCAGTAAAQAQQLPPVKPLGPVERSSKELLRNVSAVRALPDGRVLVNDLGGRKVVLFDATLDTFTVVADTTSATGNAYSSRAGGLIAWKGDSTLFIDPQSLSMLVLDGNGKIARVMSAPRANDVAALIGGPSGTPGIDGRGRLVYRAMPSMKMPARMTNGTFTPPEIADSAAVVRFDLAARTLDTVAFVKTPKPNIQMSQNDKGQMSVMVTMNPMPIVDDWALLRDGTVAVVRSQDFHIDWFRADGSKASTPKIPFDWKRLSDSDKIAFLDSAKANMEKARERMFGRQAGAATDTAKGKEAPASAQTVYMRAEVRQGGAPQVAMSGERGANVAIPPINMVSPSELPDYAPAFGPGAARGDGDGNLWIRTSTVIGGGSVYDIVNPKGELTARLLVPKGRVIAGFGKGGAVYMGVTDGDGVRLEMARVP